MQPSFLDETYARVNFNEKPLAKGEYDNCAFISCDLSGVNLSEILFIDCKFEGCNLSGAKLGNTVLREVRFIGCKMLGLLFGDCNKFALTVSFQGCVLNDCSFYRTKITNTDFLNCQMRGVDLTECDLAGSVLSGCDLMDATFDRTILEKADLRTSVNFSIDPATNRIKKAKFSLSEVAGLLYKYDIMIDRGS